MKILYVITGLGMGGAEIQLSHVSSKMVGLGHDVTILSMTGPQAVEFDASIKIHQLNMKKNFISIISGFFYFLKLLKLDKYDVVHSHMIHANIFSRLSRFFVPIRKIICTAHSTSECSGFFSFVYRITNYLCDDFTHVSKAGIDEFELRRICSMNSMSLVPNGVDFGLFKFDPIDRASIKNKFNLNNKRIILSVGRFDTEKNHKMLIKSFVSLNLIMPDTVLILIGDGKEKNNLNNLVSEFGMSESVFFLGIKNDIYKYLSAADLFVLPSKWEGFGIAVLEAMACKCLVLSTDCGGVKEVIGGFGTLVPVDDVDRMSEEMFNILSYKDEFKDDIVLGAYNYAKENYSLEHISQLWMSKYIG